MSIEIETNVAPLFKVGQLVGCEVAASGKFMPACKIIALLPPSNGMVQYRIKSQNETFERMVVESQLQKM